MLEERSLLLSSLLRVLLLRDLHHHRRASLLHHHLLTLATHHPMIRTLPALSRTGTPCIFASLPIVTYVVPVNPPRRNARQHLSCLSSLWHTGARHRGRARRQFSCLAHRTAPKIVTGGREGTRHLRMHHVVDCALRWRIRRQPPPPGSCARWLKRHRPVTTTTTTTTTKAVHVPATSRSWRRCHTTKRRTARASHTKERVAGSDLKPKQPNCVAMA